MLIKTAAFSINSLNRAKFELFAGFIAYCEKQARLRIQNKLFLDFMRLKITYFTK